MQGAYFAEEDASVHGYTMRKRMRVCTGTLRGGGCECARVHYEEKEANVRRYTMRRGRRMCMDTL